MKLKQWQNIFHVIVSATRNSNQKWNIKTCQCVCENCRKCKSGIYVES